MTAAATAVTTTKTNHHNLAPQEAIPKLKIKVDSTSSTLQNLSSFSATNSSSCSSSISNSSSSSISQVQNSSGAKEAISLVSDEGVKVTLKPLSEPPLPKLTIKTNSATDTAEVVLVNNPSSMRSEYLTTHTISSSSLSSSYSVNNAEDNLSTCSSGSASSFSSNSSSTAVDTTNDIKLIIKATSTGGSCVVSGDTKKTTKRQIEQSKLVDALRTASPIQKSSTRGNAKSNAGAVATDENIIIPKVTIKPVLNPNDGPDVCSSEQPRVTPKIILKPIPKPIDKPLEIITAPGSPFSRSSEANESQQSPRIILKINKNATSQTTEAILLTKPSLMLASPIIHTTVAGTETQTNSSDSYASSPKSSTLQNDLKRLSTVATTNAKKLKLMAESEDDDDVVHLLSSDSESEPLNHNIESEVPASVMQTAVAAAEETEQIVASTPSESLISSLHANSDLRSILSRPQLEIPPPLQNFGAQGSNIVSPALTSTISLAVAAAAEDDNAVAKSGGVIDLCDDSNDMTCKASPSSTIDVPTPPSSNIVAAAAPTAALRATSATTATVTNANDSNQNNSDRNQLNISKTSTTNYKWPFFYGAEEKRPEPIHPLLQHNIARANVLEAMMNAANNRDKCHTANGGNNNSTPNDNNFEKTLKRKNELMLDNDGSSSDCIVIEDTGSEPFPFGTGDKNADQNQNGQKKESVDRDSGVDVSSSVKSASGDGHDEDVTPVKRPRGRPRKDGTPAGSIKSATSK